MKKILLFIICFSIAACAPKQPPLPVTLLNKDAISQMRKQKGYWIEVQIPQRKVVLAKGEHIIKTFPVAVGMPEFPTPVGTRAIDRIVWNPWWIPPPSKWATDYTPMPPRTIGNPLGEIKMPLGQGSYLIHGTKAVTSIGQWASHGCIRMLFEDIFGLVQLLMTEYSKESAVDMMETANRQRNKEFTSPLDLSVPVVLTYDLVKVHDGYVMISPDLYKRQPNFVAYIQEEVQPYLKNKKASKKRIQQLLKVFRNQMIHVPLQNLVSGVTL